MDRKNLVALMHALLGAAAVVGSVMVRGQMGIPAQPAKAIGLAVFVLGTALFAWSLFYLRQAFMGNVDPAGDALVTDGPYHLIRHPVYLAMLAMSIGLAVAMRSILGLALTVLGFLPAAIYRAKLEEQALEAKYGEVWKTYRDRTPFMIPGMY